MFCCNWNPDISWSHAQLESEEWHELGRAIFRPWQVETDCWGLLFSLMVNNSECSYSFFSLRIKCKGMLYLPSESSVDNWKWVTGWWGWVTGCMPVGANSLTTMRKLSYLAMVIMVIIPLLCISCYTVAGGSFGRPPICLAIPTAFSIDCTQCRNLHRIIFDAG